MLDHALDILQSIWKWLAFGIVVSAAINTFVPDDFFAGLSDAGAIVPILAALLVSLPLYVCATASVPIAAALVASGMPTGAALVFLMAGPATNVATIGAVYRALGGRSLAVYLITIIAGSIGAGLLFDSLVATGSAHVGHLHDHTAWWAIASAVILLALMGWFAMNDLKNAFGSKDTPDDALEVPVAGMTCAMCVKHVTKALEGTEGVDEVNVTLEPGRALVRGNVGREAVERAIVDAGYTVPGTA